MTNTVLLSIDGPIASITLNDPAKHNRLNPEGLKLLREAVDRARASGDVRPKISDYKTVDFTLRTTRGIKQWDLTASVRNVFNADVREPSLAPGLSIPNDLPLARRTIYIQAVYKM